MTDRNRVSRTTGVGFDVFAGGNSLDKNKSSKAGTIGFQLDDTGGDTLIKNRASRSGTLDLLDNSGGRNSIDDSNRFKTVGP